jgi:hypothetical protein
VFGLTHCARLRFATAQVLAQFGRQAFLTGKGRFLVTHHAALQSVAPLDKMVARAKARPLPGMLL